MKALISIVLFVYLTLLSSCLVVENDPDGDFDYELEGDCDSPVLGVIFKNLSKKATSYLWEFGDGTTSDDFEPKKIYDKAGVYTVRLTSSGSIHEEEIVIRRNSDGMGPSAEFSFTKDNTSTLVNFAVSLPSTASYFWEFGDGTFVTVEDSVITHSYAGNNKCIVELVATNETGSNCSEISISIGP